MKIFVLTILMIPPLLVGGAILLNRPGLFESPGPWPRLRAYLTSNVAQTANEHPFPELRLALFRQSSDALRGRVLQAMRGLGWQKIREHNGVIHAEVVTPLLRFRDDVSARIEPLGRGSLLHLRSSSRVGRADFAANRRHLVLLIERLNPDQRR